MKSDSEQERYVNPESGFVQTCMINLSSLAENYSCDSPGCNEGFIMADNGKKVHKENKISKLYLSSFDIW